MSRDPKTPEKLEIAHVLFMDIVKFSTLPMDQQLQLIQQLKAIIRRTEEFRNLEGTDQLIRIPTGDGMALVFFGDPESPARCALAISRALLACPELKLRMGVHSGPVIRNVSVDEKENVTGSGINMAQRVMDCGDAGHILLSGAVANVLSELRTWQDWLHDLGETEVKHSVRIQIFNLYKDELGNRELPEKLRVTHQDAPSSDQRITEKSAAAATAVGIPKMKLTLLYKRNAHPDEHVLALLETDLRKHGHEVFVDRHMSVGVEWAQEIERQVRTSDAVIPLLSAASVTSEMLAYEVQTAHDAAQKQNGKPRLLPVRVNFEGGLPDALAAILNPLQYATWTSAQDSNRLAEELLNSFRNPPTSPVDLRRLEPIGGAVPIDSKFYIVRPTDDQFLAAIERRDSIVLVKGARQMGKTSLLARGMKVARETGAKVLLTDFQSLSAAHLESVGALYLTLSELIADQLDLDVLPQEVWKAERGPSVNFQRYMRREVLGKISGPLVWGLDEVDRLFTCPFGSEVFGLFRSWHNARSLDPDGPWKHLTMAIAYATEAHLFISDLNQSPFNVGTRLVLDDFTPSQVAELNRRYDLPLKGQAEVNTFYGLVSGHPFLVRKGLHEMASDGISLITFSREADRDEGPFGDHLRRFLVLLAQDTAVCDVMREVLRGRPCPSTESFYRLRSAGLLAGDSVQEARPRCQLYTNYLSRHLL